MMMKRAAPSKDSSIKKQTQELLRSLPSVAAVLSHNEVQEWLHGLPRNSVVSAVQLTLDRFRKAILSGDVDHPIELDEILADAEQELAEQSTPSLRAVINATGIVLHTGLGRAPLCDAAIEAIAECASGYCNLEFDLKTGERGRRADHVNELLCRLTGADAAAVVNNNAAATLLILRVLAAGREVIVSRGQLVEIGGSFRLPEIMSASGAILREVGTTNRTRATDYERAINDRTAMLVRVHPSNYRIVGFAEEVPIAELAALAHRFNLIAVDDLGSGMLTNFDFRNSENAPEKDMAEEPSIAASILAGADLVCCSGDKLLGGPQCGLILGRRALIERIESDPLMRTYRVDKLTLAALEATLREYSDPEAALSRLPTWEMFRVGTEQLAERARKLLERLQKSLPTESFFVGSDVGFAGGGAMPAREFETVVIRWQPSGMSADAMIEALRRAEVPVIARIRDDAVCLDLRTIRAADFDDLVDAAYEAVYGAGLQDESNGISLPILE